MHEKQLKTSVLTLTPSNINASLVLCCSTIILYYIANAICEFHTKRSKHFKNIII